MYCWFSFLLFFFEFQMKTCALLSTSPKFHFSFDSVRFAIFFLGPFWYGFISLPFAHMRLWRWRSTIHFLFIFFSLSILVFSKPDIYLVKWHCLHYIRCVNILNCINYSSMIPWYVCVMCDRPPGICKEMHILFVILKTFHQNEKCSQNIKSHQKSYYLSKMYYIY